MPAIITNKFRINNAEQFSESFSEASPEVYYLGIGRPQAFATQTRGDLRTENQGTDSAAITPADSVVEEFNTYDDLLAVKKISASDTSFVIPRRNWTNGTIYDYYRHDYGNRITGTTTIQSSYTTATTLFDSTFYVLTTDRNVYKCLDNNGNVASTTEPTGTSTSILTTADGYRWKYMYTLSATQQANFLSTDFMAVATNSTVSSAAIDGQINVAKIKSAGLRLGISTHGYYEFLQAQAYQPSYIAVGAIFPTKTKDMSGQIQGVERLARLVSLNTDIPMVAIGGINLANATEVLATNVGSIAVVTAITEADNPEVAVIKFEELIACR